MGEDTQTLDEVVVTALGIKREQKALSYNVQQVKGEALTAVKDANFINSLAGKVAGVQISSGATGAGGATRVVMRGMKSLTKNNNALLTVYLCLTQVQVVVTVSTDQWVVLMQ